MSERARFLLGIAALLREEEAEQTYTGTRAYRYWSFRAREEAAYLIGDGV